MQHQIPHDASDDRRARMAQAVSSCVHCGFCLPACPTYRVLGEEMDSPRGRIVLMKEVLEGALRLDEAAPHLDRCLGCLACETACPSGVRYRDLIEPMRERVEAARRPVDRVRRSWLLGVTTGAALLPIGALANLLWLRILRAEGLAPSWRRYVALTLPVAGPALLAAALTLAGERAVFG